jgi:hypothetical protein
LQRIEESAFSESGLTVLFLPNSIHFFSGSAFMNLFLNSIMFWLGRCDFQVHELLIEHIAGRSLNCSLSYGVPHARQLRREELQGAAVALPRGRRVSLGQPNERSSITLLPFLACTSSTGGPSRSTHMPMPMSIRGRRECVINVRWECKEARADTSDEGDHR